MKKSIQKFLVVCLLAVLVLNVFELPVVNQMSQVQAATLTGKVSSSKLKIYSSQSKSSKKLKTIKKGKKVIILETGKEWVKVSVGGVVGYVKGKHVKTSYGNASNPYANALTGKANKTVTLRSKKSNSSAPLGSILKGSNLQILSVGSKWTKVKVGNKIGYIKSSHIGGGSAGGSVLGSALVAYAKRFLGNPYVYGGSSLTNGTDCSGFVMALYRYFGYKLPHSSSALRKVGRAVKGGIKNARPGDIICYNGHVAIYMGNNRIIHASTPSTGIKITNNASYRKIVAIRRIFK